MIPVTPEMSLIPKKYHVFISPSLRRVYLEDTSRALIDSLNTEITLLKARVGTLKRDKDLLMDRCEAAQSAVSRLTSDERTARLELIEAKEEVREANIGIKDLRSAYFKLESM
jgi:outer membrane murein-binding lipoprotein Lpp